MLNICYTKNNQLEFLKNLFPHNLLTQTALRPLVFFRMTRHSNIDKNVILQVMQDAFLVFATNTMIVIRIDKNSCFLSVNPDENSHLLNNVYSYEFQRSAIVRFFLLSQTMSWSTSRRLNFGEESFIPRPRHPPPLPQSPRQLPSRPQSAPPWRAGCHRSRLASPPLAVVDATPSPPSPRRCRCRGTASAATAPTCVGMSEPRIASAGAPRVRALFPSFWPWLAGLSAMWEWNSKNRITPYLKYFHMRRKPWQRPLSLLHLFRQDRSLARRTHTRSDIGLLMRITTVALSFLCTCTCTAFPPDTARQLHWHFYSY